MPFTLTLRAFDFTVFHAPLIYQNKALDIYCGACGYRMLIAKGPKHIDPIVLFHHIYSSVGYRAACYLG